MYHRSNPVDPATVMALVQVGGSLVQGFVANKQSKAYAEQAALEQAQAQQRQVLEQQTLMAQQQLQALQDAQKRRESIATLRKFAVIGLTFVGIGAVTATVYLSVKKMRG